MDDVLTKSRHSFVIDKDHRQTPAYKWLHFFHKWFKPVFAEFVATFILLFWACMLQPKPGAELSAMYQVSVNRDTVEYKIELLRFINTKESMKNSIGLSKITLELLKNSHFTRSKFN